MSRPRTGGDLVAIHRLEFYRKQKSWKFRHGMAKRADPKPQLNLTYCVEKPGPKSPKLNDAFLDCSDKNLPLSDNSSQISPKVSKSCPISTRNSYSNKQGPTHLAAIPLRSKSRKRRRRRNKKENRHPEKNASNTKEDYPKETSTRTQNLPEDEKSFPIKESVRSRNRQHRHEGEGSEQDKKITKENLFGSKENDCPPNIKDPRPMGQSQKCSSDAAPSEKETQPQTRKILASERLEQLEKLARLEREMAPEVEIPDGSEAASESPKSPTNLWYREGQIWPQSPRNWPEPTDLTDLLGLDGPLLPDIIDEVTDVLSYFVRDKAYSNLLPGFDGPLPEAEAAEAVPEDEGFGDELDQFMREAHAVPHSSAVDIQASYSTDRNELETSRALEQTLRTGGDALTEASATDGMTPSTPSLEGLVAQQTSSYEEYPTKDVGWLHSSLKTSFADNVFLAGSFNNKPGEDIFNGGNGVTGVRRDRIVLDGLSPGIFENKHDGAQGRDGVKPQGLTPEGDSRNCPARSLGKENSYFTPGDSKTRNYLGHFGGKVKMGHSYPGYNVMPGAIGCVAPRLDVTPNQTSNIVPPGNDVTHGQSIVGNNVDTRAENFPLRHHVENKNCPRPDNLGHGFSFSDLGQNMTPQLSPNLPPGFYPEDGLNVRDLVHHTKRGGDLQHKYSSGQMAQDVHPKNGGYHVLPDRNPLEGDKSGFFEKFSPTPITGRENLRLKLPSDFGELVWGTGVTKGKLLTENLRYTDGIGVESMIFNEGGIQSPYPNKTKVGKYMGNSGINGTNNFEARGFRDFFNESVGKTNEQLGYCAMERGVKFDHRGVTRNFGSENWGNSENFGSFKKGAEYVGGKGNKNFSSVQDNGSNDHQNTESKNNLSNATSQKKANEQSKQNSKRKEDKHFLENLIKYSRNDNNCLSNPVYVESRESFQMPTTVDGGRDSDVANGNKAKIVGDSRHNITGPNEDVKNSRAMAAIHFDSYHRNMGGIENPSNKPARQRENDCRYDNIGSLGNDYSANQRFGAMQKESKHFGVSIQDGYLYNRHSGDLGEENNNLGGNNSASVADQIEASGKTGLNNVTWGFKGQNIKVLTSVNERAPNIGRDTNQTVTESNYYQRDERKRTGPYKKRG